MRLLVSSDFHLSPTLTYQCLSMLEDVDAFIYLGDYCNKAGIDSSWYGGCNPQGIHEVRLLYDFMRAVNRVGVPSLFVAGNHEPSAKYMPWSMCNWSIFHKPSNIVWHGSRGRRLIVQIYPTGYEPICPPAATCTAPVPERVSLLLSHEPIKNYRKYYSPNLYAHGHIHTRGGHTYEGYLNAACGNYIVEL